MLNIVFTTTAPSFFRCKCKFWCLRNKGSWSWSWSRSWSWSWSWSWSRSWSRSRNKSTSRNLSSRSSVQKYSRIRCSIANRVTNRGTKNSTWRRQRDGRSHGGHRRTSLVEYQSMQNDTSVCLSVAVGVSSDCIDEWFSAQRASQTRDMRRCAHDPKNTQSVHHVRAWQAHRCAGIMGLQTHGTVPVSTLAQLLELLV